MFVFYLYSTYVIPSFNAGSKDTILLSDTNGLSYPHLDGHRSMEESRAAERHWQRAIRAMPLVLYRNVHMQYSCSGMSPSLFRVIYSTDPN